MNNACPTCGAVYAVTAKDIGRKIRCKKCSTALRVDVSGLVEDAPSAAAPALPPPAQAVPAVPAAVADEDDAPVVSTRGKKDRRPYDPAARGEFLKKLGGIPTILFSIGVFLVIWFTFQAKIGEAAVARADAYKSKLELDMDSELKALLPKDKQTKAGVESLTADERKSFAEKGKPVIEKYQKKMTEADEDAQATRVSNIRAVWYERYGTMFGFLFVAFGCIGYLRSEQPLIIRIVAAVILAFMMMIVFSSFGGCGGSDKIPSLPKLGKGGGSIPGIDGP